MDFTAKAKGLFDRNPHIIRYFFTNDYQVFELRRHAEAYVYHRKDKTITELFRPEMSAAEIKAFKDAEAAQLKAGTEAAYRRAFPELAKCIDDNVARLGVKSSV